MGMIFVLMRGYARF